MPRKKLIAASCVAVLLVPACASLRPTDITTTPPGVATAPSLTAAPKPTPRPIPRPTAKPVTGPARPTTPIRANVVREGNSLLISRGPTTAPVPLFRQAIVLASVRAAVAGLPAQPKAEFQRGLLTLNFPTGTQPEITTAINRAIEVPEVNRLRANLPQ